MFSGVLVFSFFLQAKLGTKNKHRNGSSDISC